MQMQGNFDAAIKLFNELLANDAIHTAGLLADMGMVAGAFRQLSEIQVPESVNRRQVMHDSLKTGEHYFSEAAEKYGSDAPNAQYALAVLTYLECMNPEEKGSCTDSKRTKSLEYVNNALAGMTSSESLGAYEELGIIGRARFMQAVLMMGSCETSQTRKAMNAWREISAEAGMLPVWDIKALIESAELMEHHEYALEISESIWSHRQADALDIITSSKLLTESTVLRTGLLSLAREEKGAGEETWSHWTLLIPAFLKKNEIDLAEEGLDRLEGIAVNGRFSEKMLEWLELPEHYDPAWSEEEALRARFRLLRRLGRDADAFDQLRQLFFMLRDQRFEEASQVHALFKEYGANEDFYTDLVLQTPDEGSSVVEPQLLDRLREGEKMRVLFIGGNEIQARYDESVMQSLTSEWPGMHVQFEHTGWSSNWGKEVDRLKRLAIQSDAVVLMTMMRTTLGRTMRAALNDPPRPWIPCTGTGRQAVHNSIRKAAIVALKLKER